MTKMVKSIQVGLAKTLIKAITEVKGDTIREVVLAIIFAMSLLSMLSRTME